MKLLYQKKRFIARVLLLIISIQVMSKPVAFALTSGPTQPEVQAFQPAGTTEMVDLFTGDFGYNIPLFELPGPNGGYPFNLSYQSGISMDQESSWVGLGWSLNPGAINRQMRGLPDEFNGDVVHTKMSIAPSITIGVGLGTGIELFGGSLGLGAGLSVYQNNYRGIGYALDGSVSYSKAVSSNMTAGVGLNVSLDSKEGVNVSPSLSLGGNAVQVGLRAGYNSKQGLTEVSVSTAGLATTGVTLSLAHPGYTPQISMAMRNLNLSTTFKIGGAWWGISFMGYVNGYYNEQKLKDDKKMLSTKAYGYINFQHVPDDNSLLDFNREKDGMVSKESPNLAMPSLTYDIYSVAGQGISAMYRPFRNDIGVIHDQAISSVSVGGALGVDVGIPSHVGINLSVNHSKSTSGPWTGNNDVEGAIEFKNKYANDSYEPWYFKAHGEQSSKPTTTLTALGSTDAVRIGLSSSNTNPVAQQSFEKNDGWVNQVPDSSLHRERALRTNVIQPITNEQLLKNNQEILSVFKIRYDSQGVEKVFNRSSMPGHHNAGFTALTPEGLRYNYGLPAYNLYQEEVSFSAKKLPGQANRVNVGSGGNGDPDYSHRNTDKYLKRVEIPKYAHAFLLTSITGPDYVDITNDGVSTDDLGYWVKFTYKKTTTASSPYKWRDPFSQAHFQEGWKTDPRDDRGSFTYGEKELWYLTKAETKSHIAAFTLEERHDGLGVASKLQDTNAVGKAVSALKEIRLYTRSTGGSYPIKVVKFQYDYSLCKGVYNSNNTSDPAANGKLTLKKVWFEYGNSLRGSLNPYVFTYQENNPSYDLYAYDRWGNYKPYPTGNYRHNIDFPYAEQNPLLKDQIDQNAAAWSLHEIKLPSSGKVIIDYESDDYAYVQNEEATQMMPLVDPGSSPTSPDYLLRDDRLKIKFKLEQPITEALTREARKNEVLKYLDQKRKQLFFKLKIDLRHPSENFQEYISGYADIDFDKLDSLDLEKDGTGKYVYGFFFVKAEDGHHPFSMRAWQHLRTNQPDLANAGKRLEQTDDPDERVDQIKGLGSVTTQVSQMFKGFYNFCGTRDWGRKINAAESWIRLKSPDKMKYGGGLRVRQITMKDNWSEAGNVNEEGIYGQVYEYTTEEDNKIISSGVAAYEPIIGGEENAMHYVKKYTQSIPLRSDNNLFFEYPLNESYYPGPQVGYSKVTVTSLAAASLLNKALKNSTLSTNKSLFPTGEGVSYGTTGATVQEFYTAKDFPIIADETDKINRPYKLALTIPLLGNISIFKLASSQGYSIITNDMHGKPKRVQNFRQTNAGTLEAEPISWVKYNYQADTVLYHYDKVLSVRNSFTENSDGTLSLSSNAGTDSGTFTIGQEEDFFVDIREFEDNAWGGGVYVNLDAIIVLFGVIPIPSAWPNVSKSKSQLRTAVTNKVIFKTGILESTEAYDGGSRVITKNLKWDKLTGAPVLTVVNTNFDSPLYSYTIPAYTQYQGMGAAYQNIGLTLGLKNVNSLPYHDNFYEFTPAVTAKLFPGDEIILYSKAGHFRDPIAKVIFTGEENGALLLYSETPLDQTDYNAMIVRSGYRNQLHVNAGSITALQDPSRQGINVSHSKIITVPKEN